MQIAARFVVQPGTGLLTSRSDSLEHSPHGVTSALPDQQDTATKDTR
jgi:hypothetical protein